MFPLVIFDDLELFLCGWYRAALAARPEAVCQNVTVGIRESNAPRQVIIRDDGGFETSPWTGERSVGISVLAGTKEQPQDAVDLARIVHALRSQIPSLVPGNPVTAVLSSNGPYAVQEAQPLARRYLTLTLAIAARQLNG